MPDPSAPAQPPTADTASRGKAAFRTIPLDGLSDDELADLSARMKLSLSVVDMRAARDYFRAAGRAPTDVELEVIAQTWSEHCKHRIFGARIDHDVDGRRETVDGLFRTFIRDVTNAIRERKPNFVLAAFDDNAGFIRLDETTAACLKVETHNHPSAIEPYAGANTGLGGVIRDILGAGKGARPVASLDVFCFGSPDTTPSAIKADDVIHPLGMMRGVVRGVRDYGNRMGIPTVAGAIQFDPAYIYNPLVFCGTAGLIPITDIAKRVEAGLKIVAVGGRTGRDGLHGATFSSAGLDTESHEEDQQAVQIGNPIEEKKVADFIIEARRRGLIEFVTDCGAGGFSSAAGEMLSEAGGEIRLENAPLKEPGLTSWEIFLSESQERMVLAVRDEAVPELRELADVFETELSELGCADGSGILKVTHHGETVCELDCGKLHDAPRRSMTAQWSPPKSSQPAPLDSSDLGGDLRALLGDFAIVSRAPIIREYDHEVQGNTLLKPLAGAEGDAPQDGAVIRVDGSRQLVAMTLSLLPEWGKTDPYAMGAACVDETIRQLACCGADPDRIGILDNFCVGNPEDPRELGALVETVKGMSAAALDFGAPFISGKDSFYNYFETDEGPVSIPVTLLVSGIGIVDNWKDVTGSSLRRADSFLYLLGNYGVPSMGGSVFARLRGISNAPVPATDAAANLACYRALHRAIRDCLVLAAHDVSEGGLAVCLAEMGFSGRAGIEVEIAGADSPAADLFNEAPGRVVVEVASERAGKFESLCRDVPCARLGAAASGHRRLVIRGEDRGELLIDDELSDLKAIWKNGLTPYY